MYSETVISLMSLTSSPKVTCFPGIELATPENSRPLSDCKIKGGPIVVKISIRAQATADDLLLVIGIENMNLTPWS